MANGFTYLEQIVEAIHNGNFNESMLHWSDGTDRAIIFYMYKNKASIQDAAETFGFEEDF